MSTPTNRGQRGGSATRGGGRATPFQPTRGRGTFRGGATPNTTPRGRGRGRGGAALSSASGGGDGLLQRLRAGTTQRGPTDGTVTSGGGMRAGARASPWTKHSLTYKQDAVHTRAIEGQTLPQALAREAVDEAVALCRRPSMKLKLRRRRLLPAPPLRRRPTKETL